MSTDISIPSEVMARMQEAADKAAKGGRDPEEMRKACEDMDRIREELYRKHGLMDIGVSAIREVRDAWSMSSTAVSASNGCSEKVTPIRH